MAYRTKRRRTTRQKRRYGTSGRSRRMRTPSLRQKAGFRL